MIPFKQFIKEAIDIELLKTTGRARRLATNFINDVTTSSKLGALPVDADVFRLLQRTVNSTPYTLYRGLCFWTQTPEEKAYWGSFKPGSTVDDEFRCPKMGQAVIHTSSSLAVAESYSGGDSDVSVVMKIECDPSAVLFDGNNVGEVFFPEEFENKDLFAYFKREKEVLLFKDSLFNATIMEVKIR